MCFFFQQEHTLQFSIGIRGIICWPVSALLLPLFLLYFFASNSNSNTLKMHWHLLPDAKYLHSFIHSFIHPFVVCVCFTNLPNYWTKLWTFALRMKWTINNERNKKKQKTIRWQCARGKNLFHAHLVFSQAMQYSGIVRMRNRWTRVTQINNNLKQVNGASAEGNAMRKKWDGDIEE